MNKLKKQSRKLFIIKYRWLIIGLSLFVSLILGLQIPQAEIDPDVNAMIPSSMESRVNTKKIEEVFGSSDILLAFMKSENIINPESLQRIRKLDQELNRVNGVEKVLSLASSHLIRSDRGMMVVEDAVMNYYPDESEIKSLRKKILNSDILRSVVISEDFKYALFVITIDNEMSTKEVVSSVEEVFRNVPGSEEVSFGGLAFIKEELSRNINNDLKRLLPLSLVLMILILTLTMRSWKGVMFPFLVVLLSIVAGMGLLPLFGWKITIITLLLPVMLIAIANNYGIHIMAKYQELFAESRNETQNTIIVKIYESLKTPVLLTGLTTIAGILGLLSHIIIPARQMGVVASISIGYSLLLSVFLILALLSFMKKPGKRERKKVRKINLIEKILHWIGHLVVKNPVSVVVVSLFLIVAVGYGLSYLRVDGNVENFFSEKSVLKKSMNIINQEFGGGQNLSLMFAGDIKDPELMKRIDAYETEFSKMEGVGQAISIARVVREMSKALNSPGEPGYDSIPKSRQAIAQYFELYSMSGDPDDFEQLVDFDYEHAQIMLRLNNGNAEVIKKLVSRIKEKTKSDPALSCIGGYGLVSAEMTESLIKGQKTSLLLAILVVSALMMIIFRSFRAGLIGAIPLIAAVVILFGLMGYLQIAIDPATALLSSIMIGVGVDYTIHLLWRIKLERKMGKSFSDAIVKTIRTTGRGISFNAFSVMIGFAALLASNFLPVRFFGFLVLVSIFCCLVAALILVPALIMLMKPSFLNDRKNNN